MNRHASAIAENGLLAADESRWMRISEVKSFVFNPRSSAFIGGQPCVCVFLQPGQRADKRSILDSL
jgi:hypothetical protein